MACDELETFRNNFARLACSLDAESVANAAFSAGLISQGDLDEYMAAPKNKKEVVFLMAVGRGVERDRENFYEFLQLLRDVPAHTHLLDGLSIQSDILLNGK